MLNIKVKEKNKKSQEKRYVIQLCFNWTCRAKNKKKAEEKAREEFLRKLKDMKQKIFCGIDRQNKVISENCIVV
jgi:dsRNA-specific ribonuclease